MTPKWQTPDAADGPTSQWLSSENRQRNNFVPERHTSAPFTLRFEAFGAQRCADFVTKCARRCFSVVTVGAAKNTYFNRLFSVAGTSASRTCAGGWSVFLETLSGWGTEVISTGGLARGGCFRVQTSEPSVKPLPTACASPSTLAPLPILPTQRRREAAGRDARPTEQARIRPLFQSESAAGVAARTGKWNERRVEPLYLSVSRHRGSGPGKRKLG